MVIVTPTKEQVAEILRLHKLWLAGEPEGKKANLCGADLYGANLRGANLCGADLYGANLRGADLSSADLRSADLRSADLRSADLSSADLRSADLRSADLRSADLSSANLRGADLRSADLRGADLRSADLRGANLRSADLRSADLRSAVNASLALALTEIVPREGVVYGWKKCRSGVLVKLRIPADARRSNATGRKCRAEWAEVIEVVGAEVGVSIHDGFTEYRAGATVKPHAWGTDRLIECAPGIHFYTTREEAEAHT